MSQSSQFDQYLDRQGPAAFVIREPLMPVEGVDGVVFPATYAAGDGFQGGYNIDEFSDGKNVCLVDSVGSQANRIETLFAQSPYDALVPQLNVQAGEKVISILEAGHRAGDAIVRCSSLQLELQNAFKSVLKGDAMPMAKLAPTSLVFGVWDSRDTQAKMPRLVSSTIRAYDVKKLRRSAQFNPATDYENDGLLPEKEKANEKAYSERGFIHVPATATHGGVIATGGIRRDATLSLAALKLIRTSDPKKTLELQRYILGLSLVAFTSYTSGYLRQGCLLVRNHDMEYKFDEVYPDGTRKPCGLTPEDALSFAQAAAKAFGVGESRTVPFDRERAIRDIKGEGDTKKTKAAKKKGKPAESEGSDE
ncbi:type I-G CRISPR-associated RAMP protein Csb1/Cas7g [Lacunimicrobium album]